MKRAARGALIVLLAANWWAAPVLAGRSQPRQGDPPRRIVSLIPAVTEMLIALGAEAQLAGVSSFDRLPSRYDGVTRVGGLLDPDTERILALRPDLVIFYGTQTELREQLARAGIPTFSYEHGGLDDIAATVRALGARIGRAPEGERIAAEIESGIADVRRRVAGKPRPRTLLVFGRDPGSLRNIDASGGVGFLHDMLTVAGATNIFADAQRQLVRATTELILARAPEVIVELLTDSKSSAAGSAADRAAWNVLSSVPAVRAGRVYVVDGDRLGRPGSGVIESILILARVLHPDVFPAVKNRVDVGASKGRP